MTYSELEAYAQKTGPKAPKYLGELAQEQRIRYVDRLKIQVQAGTGGSGSRAFDREKHKAEGPPTGGDGGRGGDVIIMATDNAQLNRIGPSHQALPGESGGMRGKSGKKGDDKLIRVPPGTLVYHYIKPARKIGKILADLDEEGSSIVVAKGGGGGRGNRHFATGANRSPRNSEEGGQGERRWLYLELKTIADIGLVGFPNAGKSSLLAVVSNAKPRIASFPFTTINPYVGVVELKDFTRTTVADLPGLLEGASENVGLGHEFLRHIERTKALCYVLDMSPLENQPDPWTTFQILREELRVYNASLMQRPFILVANKMDLPKSQENLEKLKKRKSTFRERSFPSWQKREKVLKDSKNRSDASSKERERRP
ncbi:GTPase [Planoprotostelium fungivorum]|uniref:GTPase n=1 Tax=Planoprotostelium fungivorum TaxID=1890364 RepID=A0A2P6NTQ4_9EUKA|nr:GTPase [Planoprotostelium fungivorum]